MNGEWWNSLISRINNVYSNDLRKERVRDIGEWCRLKVVFFPLLLAILKRLTISHESGVACGKSISKKTDLRKGFKHCILLHQALDIEHNIYIDDRWLNKLFSMEWWEVRQKTLRQIINQILMSLLSVKGNKNPAQALSSSLSLLAKNK